MTSKQELISKIGIRDELVPYELFVINQVSQETMRCYSYQLEALNRFMREERGIPELCNTTPADILSYKQSLSDLALATQKRYLATVRSFFRWAYESGLHKANPAAEIRLPRAVQGKAPTFITIEETRCLLDTVDIEDRYARRDLAMLWCFAHGLRLSEVADLNVGHVVPHVGNDGGLAHFRVSGKGSKERKVPIGENAHKAIVEYLEERSGRNADAPLFACTYAGETGRRMSRRGLQERFKILAERAGLSKDKHHPHVMRHGFATRMLFQSHAPGGIYTVSRLLGHSRVSTTEMYMHCSHERLEEAMLSDPLARTE